MDCRQAIQFVVTVVRNFVECIRHPHRQMRISRVVTVPDDQRPIRSVVCQQINPIVVIDKRVAAVEGIAVVHPFFGFLRQQTIVVVGVLLVPGCAVGHHPGDHRRQNLRSLVIRIGFPLVVVPRELSLDESIGAGIALRSQSMRVRAALDLCSQPVPPAAHQAVPGGGRIVCRISPERDRKVVEVARVPVIGISIPHPGSERIAERCSGRQGVTVAQGVQRIRDTRIGRLIPVPLLRIVRRGDGDIPRLGVVGANLVMLESGRPIRRHHIRDPRSPLVTEAVGDVGRVNDFVQREIIAVVIEFGGAPCPISDLANEVGFDRISDIQGKITESKRMAVRIHNPADHGILLLRIVIEVFDSGFVSLWIDLARQAVPANVTKRVGRNQPVHVPRSIRIMNHITGFFLR